MTTTTLYRPFDEAGRLLYVGISKSIATRINSHSDTSIWPQYATTIRITRYPTWGEARAAEIKAIATEDPVFNKQGRPIERYHQWIAAYPDGNPDDMIVRPGWEMSPSDGKCEFRGDVFAEAMARQGHSTRRGRAAAAGIAYMTLLRWERGEVQGTPLHAHRVALAAGLAVSQLFVPVRRSATPSTRARRQIKSAA